MSPANVFNHILPALLTLTSLLLSLITLLSPIPILHTQVSLFFLRPLPQGSVPTSSISDASLSVTSNKHSDDEEARKVPGRFMTLVQQAQLDVKNNNSTSNIESQAVETFTDDGPVGLWIGLLGSCSRLDGTMECTEPNMIPDFTSSYDRLSLSTREQSVLPWQLPTGASSLVASLVLGFLSLILLVGSSLPYHLPNKATNNAVLSFFMVHHRHMAKLACLFGITSLGIGIILTVSLRISLGNAVASFNVVNGSQALQAKLGSGFNQLWASAIIQGIGCLVAIAMCGRENLGLSK